MPGRPEGDRHLRFAQAFNCRDIGGYTTKDGGTVRWGAVYRSGTLHRLRSADLVGARSIGVRTVIDLRSTAERDRHGSAPGATLTVHHVPVFEEDALPFVWARRDDPEPPPGQDYVAIATDGGLAVVATLGFIAAEDYPLVFHCAAGKDRTGIVAALLLSCLGVGDDQILADYALSDLALDPARVWAEANDPAEAAEIAARPPWLLRSSPAVMAAFLAQLRSRHGSVQGYLAHHGAADDLVGRLRTRLLQGAGPVSPR